jgi:hypothetical protein
MNIDFTNREGKLMRVIASNQRCGFLQGDRFRELPKRVNSENVFQEYLLTMLRPDDLSFVEQC